METKYVFVATLVLLSSAAVVLQAVGYFATTWMTYDMSIHTDEKNVDISIHIGLWSTTYCKPSAVNYECRSIANAELRKNLQTSNQSEAKKVAALNLMDDFDIVAALASTGSILCIVGNILTVVFLLASKTKKFGLGSAVFWGAGSLLVLSAVLLQSRTDRNLDEDVEMREHMPEVSDKHTIQTHFPMAILVTGLGAGFGFIVALLVATMACSLDEQQHAPGTYKRLDDLPVVVKS